MSARMRPVNSQGTRVFMGTITDNALLHEALLACAREHNVQCATFEMLGGLREAQFTAYDFERQERLAPLTIRGALEIVAGHGTISLLDDAPFVHTHVIVAQRDGERVNMIGGHLASGVAFAVEFTLTAYDGEPMHRAKHESTGLMLWDTAAK